MLLGITYFISYVKKPNITSALLWQLFGIAATLFRAEGIVFILFAPLYFPVARYSLKEIGLHTIRLYTLVVPLGVICLLFLAFSEKNIGYTVLLFLHYMQPTSLLSNISDTAAQLQTSLSVVASDSIGLYMVISGLITFLITKLIAAINPIFLGIMAYGQHKRWLNLSRESYIILFFGTLSISPADRDHWQSIFTLFKIHHFYRNSFFPDFLPVCLPTHRAVITEQKPVGSDYYGDHPDRVSS
ncbi:hypothetical protein MNBD_GAMMA26-755 [hydrothermal vent metagenome]|uniref:Uncharacterized protein n=1 Tax=hydrothermal vent metagenome TaxID=652676 RepID=A0A3B1AUQ8_9ZZZZ